MLCHRFSHLLLGGACLGAQLACHSGERFDLPQRPEAAPGSPRSAALRGTPVYALALGVQYSCALLSGGAVKCWGSDEYGALGRDGPRQDIADPSSIEPIDFGTSRQVQLVSAGWHHACVLFEDGKARCWGRNEQGQLGDGSTEDYGDDPDESLALRPDLPLDHIIDISAGVSNTARGELPMRNS